MTCVWLCVTDMHFDMCVGVYMYTCIDMCIDMFVAMCMDMCVDMYIHMCIDMSIAMCTERCLAIFTDVRIDVCKVCLWACV